VCVCVGLEDRKKSIEEPTEVFEQKLYLLERGVELWLALSPSRSILLIAVLNNVVDGDKK
jgi:hypothetical protein